MHKDRSNGTWPELKAKRHHKLDDTLLQNLDVKHSDLDDETHDMQKIKKDRAAMQLSRVQNMLQDMADYNAKKSALPEQNKDLKE